MHQSRGTTPHRGPSARAGEEPAGLLVPRSSRSGRTPRWAVEEALERQRRALLSPGERRRQDRRAARAARRSARRWAKASRKRSRARRAAPAVGIVLVLALWFTPGLHQRHVLPHIRPWFPNASAPPPGVGSSEVPLGAPPAAAASGSYRFHESPDPEQEMVAFDPCRPVHYVVRPDGAPPDGPQLIAEAVAEISAATGLRFVDDGTTDENPDAEREPYQPERYGRQWAPVLVAWSDPAEVPGLAGDVAGLAGPAARQAPGGPFVYVTGQVMLDAPDLRRALEHPGGAAGVRGVIQHELGHVVGLDHVDDPHQLMHPSSRGVPGLAAGDRAGLARLGAGQCAPQL